VKKRRKAMKKLLKIFVVIFVISALALTLVACADPCAKGHDWDKGTVDKAPTCTETGLTTYKCLKCGETEQRTTEKIAHTPKDVSVPATCTTPGTTGATECKVCGAEISAGTVVPALNHNYEGQEWKVDTANNKHYQECKNGCGERNEHDAEMDDWALVEGKHVRVCTADGCTYSESHNPNMGTEWKHDADGYYKECKDCGLQERETAHDYEGQEWLVDEENGKHYQLCANGCGERNEHDADLGEWALVEGNHVRTCGETGCTVSESHAPAMNWVTTDATNHYKKCDNCTLTSDEGSHLYQPKQIEGGDDTEHAMVCVCGKIGENQGHTWVLDEDAPGRADCTKDGVKTYNCDCGAQKTESETKLGHKPSANWTTDETDHWHVCTVCGEITDIKVAHDYGEGGHALACTVCNRPQEGIKFVLKVNGVESSYGTLAEAVAAVNSADAAVITMNGDQSGSGICITTGDGYTKNITIDFHGGTYTVINNPVGSTGYETQCFQLLKDSNITIKNGTIKSDGVVKTYMIIQNYSNLTLENVTLDGTTLLPFGPTDNRIHYTLSNNYGTVTIKSGTVIKAFEKNGTKEVAFDVWYGLSSAYYAGVNVTLESGCTIDGVIEYGSQVADVADLASKATLALPAGNWNLRYSDNATCANAGITIDGVAIEHKLIGTPEYELVGDVHKHYQMCEFGCKVYAECTFDEGKVTTPATCTDEGVKTYTCSVCGGQYTEKIAALGHTEVVDKAVAPTCTETGLTEGKHCSVCGKVIVAQETVSVLGHDYDGQPWLVDEENGKHYQTCKNGCGIRNEHVAAFGEWVNTIDPNCTDEGEAMRTCSTCGITEKKVVDALGHTFADVEYIGGHKHIGTCSVCEETVEESCTIDNDTCTICKRVVYTYENKTELVDFTKQGWASGADVTEKQINDVTFTFSQDNGSNPPKYYSDKDDPSKNAVRLYSNNTMTVAVPNGYTITGITFTFGKDDGANAITVNEGEFATDSWTGSAESVIFTIGSMTKNNRRIQTVTVEYTAKLCNHFYDEWQVTTEATCTTDGEKTRTCLDCGEIDTQVIAAHHTLGTQVAAADPVCATETNGNVAYYQCEVCHKYFEDAEAKTEISDIIVAWSHTLKVVPEVPATTEANGKQSYKECEVCGAKYELDGTTKITDFDNWGIIEHNCAHETHVWKLIDGQHVYVCDKCGKDEQTDKTHAPTAGVWSVSGTQHVQSCAGADGCTLACATHEANYATDYTVIVESDVTYHAQVCECGLTANKHEQALGTPIATDDKTQHYQVCTEDGCNYQTEAVDHVIEYAYFENGTHRGTCACGETVTANCTPAGENNACSACGRIIGKKITSNTETVILEDEGYTNGQSVSSISKNSVSFSFAQGTNANNDPKYYTTGKGVRTYQGNTITIEVKNGYLTSVTFVFSGSNNFNSYESNKAAWTGKQQSWSISHTTSNASRIQKIIVAYELESSCYHDGTLVQKTACDVGCENDGISADCWYCTNCGMAFADEACTEVKAVTITPATGHTYGDLITAREGNCTDVAYLVDHFHCSVCGKYFDADQKLVEESAVIGTTDANVHSWNEWVSDEQGNHSRTCAYDTANAHSETEPCNLTLWDYDETDHWHKCSICGYDDIESMAAHDGMDDGICDTCGYNNNAVEILVDIYENGSLLKDSDVKVTFNKQGVVGETVTFTVETTDYEVVSVINTMEEVEIPLVDGVYSYTITGNLDGITVNVCKPVVVEPMSGTLVAKDISSSNTSYADFDKQPTDSDVAFIGHVSIQGTAMQMNKAANKCFIANKTEVAGGITQLSVTRGSTAGGNLTLVLSKTAINTYDDWKTAIDDTTNNPSVTLTGTNDAETIATFLASNTGYGYFAIVWISGSNTQLTSVSVSNQ